MIIVISIVIPVYNSCKYIPDCLNSILSQTYQNFEVILVNDGSTDDSRLVCEEFVMLDNRITIVSTENRGVSAARNTGIRIATGEYLTFVDSDDYLAIDALSVLLDDIEKNEADIAVCRVGYGYDCGFKADNDQGTFAWNRKEAVKEYIADNNLLYGAVCKLYRKDIIANSRFEEGRKIHEDGHFFLQALLKSKKVVVHDIVVYCYRKNMESASHAKFSEKYYDILYFGTEEKRMIDEIYPELCEKTINIEIKAKMSMLHIFCNTINPVYNKDIRKCILYVCKNKRYYVDGNNNDKRWYYIITLHLYYIYKFLYVIKYNDRISIK